MCYLRALLALALSIQFFTNVQAEPALPQGRSWSTQDAHVIRSGSDDPNAGSIQNSWAQNGVKANENGFPLPIMSPFGSYGSWPSLSTATRQRTEQPASPGRSFSNDFGDMGSRAASLMAQFEKLKSLQKFLGPNPKPRLDSDLKPWVPQPPSPLTDSGRSRLSQPQYSSPSTDSEKSKFFPPQSSSPSTDSGKSRFFPPQFSSPSTDSGKSRLSQPQSSSPSTDSWKPRFPQPQSPYDSHMQPERSPQGSMSGSSSSTPQNVPYIGKDEKVITLEKQFENNIQMVFNPPSMLPTAVVKVVGLNQKMVKARIVLDSGAQGCAIWDGVIQKLGLSESDLESEKQEHRGIAGTDTSTHKTTLKLCSRFSDFCISVRGSIANTPLGTPALLDSKAVPAESNLQLAEEETPESPTLDMLVGVDYFEQIFLHEVQPHHITGFPTFYKTNFGWMAFGKGAPGIRYMLMPPEAGRQLVEAREKLELH